MNHPMVSVTAYFYGEPGGPLDLEARRIFEHYSGHAVGAGTVMVGVNVGERDVEYLVPEHEVERCRRALRDCGFRINQQGPRLVSNKEPQTKGEYRVGISFNPSQDKHVTAIKQKAADLIDLIETMLLEKEQNYAMHHASEQHRGELRRLCALAQTDVEVAAMHAVKAATKAPMGT